MARGLLVVALALLFAFPAIADPQHTAKTADKVPLFDNLGTHHHAITTKSPRAQKYFDRVARDYPNDTDAATLFAESLMDLRPWALWTFDGQPQPGTLEIVATLEEVLKKEPIVGWRDRRAPRANG